MKHSLTPWKHNGPDSTLVLSADNHIVCTTLQDEDDYQQNYDFRENDASLIVKWVNNGPRLEKALRVLLTVAGQPITDRQQAIFDEARNALRNLTG